MSTTKQETNIPSWKPGDPIEAKRLNHLVGVVNQNRNLAQQPQNALGNRNKRTQVIQQFEIDSVDGDFLICHPFRGDTVTADLVKVAKSYLLRRTPFDGETHNGIDYTYTSDIVREADNGSTETQVVVPAYTVGDLIYATFLPIGGTQVVDDSSNPVFWLDLNLDGRAWAKQSS